FFFQAEDGIRDFHVTGVQTCALPISSARQVRCYRSLRASRMASSSYGVTIRPLWVTCCHLSQSSGAARTSPFSVASWRLRFLRRSEERRVGKERKDSWVRGDLPKRAM